MSRESLYFLEGRRLGVGEAAIGAADLGVLQGVGVFETLRVEEGRCVWLEEHLARFAKGLAALEIDPATVVDDRLRAWIGTALAAWGPEGKGSLRVTRTFGTDGSDGRLLLQVREREQVPAEVRVGIADRCKEAGDPLENLKGTSRLRNFLLRRGAQRAGLYDVLVPTHEGDLSEGTICNLFVVVAGTVWTPTLDRGCLPGVTRDRLIQVMRRLSIPIRKAAVRREHLLEADEVFLSNSSNGALPVVAVEGVREELPGAAGAIVRTVQNRYALDVERHLAGLRSASPGESGPRADPDCG